MLAYLQRKRQAAAAAQAPPAGLPPPQVPNLYSSVQRYVPDVDDKMLTDTVQCFYSELDQNSEQDFAQQLHEVLKDMRTKGDIAKAGPQFMLMDIGGGTLEIMHSLTMVPPATETPSSQLPPTSTFLNNKYPFVTAIGNRIDQADSWMVVPVEPQVFFKERKGKLAQWAAFPQPAPNDNKPMAQTGASLPFYPVLPLVGKAMVEEAINCLYPADPNQKANLKTVAHKLAPYIDKITDATAKEKAQRSLLSLVTRKHKTRNTQAVIKINQKPITEATNLPLYNWMVPIVEENLEPQLPSNVPAGGNNATTVGGNNNNTGGNNTTAVGGNNNNTGGNNTTTVGGNNNNTGGNNATTVGGNNNTINTGGNSNSTTGANGNTPSTTSVGAPGLAPNGQPLAPNGLNQTQTGLASTSQPMASNSLNQTQTGLASQGQPMASNSLNQTHTGLASNSQPMASSLNQNQTQTQTQPHSVGFANPISTLVGGAPTAPPPPPIGGGASSITLQNATPEQLAHAMMKSFFGGANTGPPPAKVARTDDKVGFDNLPDMAKLAWMTYSCAVTEKGLEPEVIALLAQPKSTRLLYFDTHMLSDLRQKDPEAFGDFHLSAQALDDMCYGKFKPVSSTDNWWNGFVGHCLPRSKEDIQAANRLYEQLRSDTGVQVQVTPGQVNKLSMKAPAPITSVYELLNFIKRIIKLMNKLMPRSYYARFAVMGYKELTFNGRQKQLEQNEEWRRIKLPEIVYTFYMVANKFFGKILEKSDFQSGFCNWYDPRDEADMVKHFTSPLPQFVPELMPVELRPQPMLPNIPRQPAIGNYNQYQGGHQPTNPSGRRNGAGNDRNNCNNNNNNNNNNNAAGTNHNNNNNNTTNAGNNSDGINRRFHPLLQEFWASVPEDRRNIGLRPYCQAAGTTVSRFVLQLGLQRDDCGLFHGTGTCVLAASGNCRNRHVQRDLNRNNAQQAVNTLRQGLQQMS